MSGFRLPVLQESKIGVAKLCIFERSNRGWGSDLVVPEKTRQAVTNDMEQTPRCKRGIVEAVIGNLKTNRNDAVLPAPEKGILLVRVQTFDKKSQTMKVMVQ